jgi:NAD(P)-dependent dehydrogenase (short-subunit alcohol dehydrogenase family)
VSDRVVLITGGAGGMGRAIARRFAEQGETVVVADIDRDRLSAITDELPGVGTISADVSNVSACQRMVDDAVSRYGRLDVLVGAAGVWVEGPADTMTESQWDRVLDVNLKGSFFACRYAIPHLVRAGGSIVLIASDYGLVGGPGASIYAASKFGVNGIVRSLALELAPLGVRVNSVCPADVDTPMLAGQARDFGGGDEAGYLDRLLATLPQGPRARFITPEEVAAVVAFLCSPEATPITGACVPMDWGVTAGY